jgi:UTP-glucose-1-phosphate uridylyltransferase
MAAGMGSRFGGVKQIAPVDKDDNLIIDYSIFDAMVTGFTKVVFVIRRDIEEAFREKIFNRIQNKIKAEYVFQELDDLPNGFKTPEGRTKPWGTTQAILAARNVINEPFCVINADDFYGRDAYVKIAKFLRKEVAGRAVSVQCTMVAYKLGKTSTKIGSFTRGICKADDNKMLVKITERPHIEVRGSKIGWVENEKFNELSKDTYVSMNIWALPPNVMPMLMDKFAGFLKENVNKEKSEYPVPVALDELLNEGKISIKMETTREKWFGFTYKEDMPVVSSEINKLVQKQVYPKSLWKGKPEFKTATTQKAKAK